MNKKCLNCGKKIHINSHFCGQKCRWEHYRKNNPNPIDAQLKIFAKITGGQFVYGCFTSIAEGLHVSRERVRQRAKILGYLQPHETLKLLKKKNCDFCGKEFIAVSLVNTFCSYECSRKFHLYKYFELKICKNCRKGYLSYRRHTRAKPRTLEILKIFSSGHDYCSKTCFGQVMGKEYGFKKIKS